HLEGHVEVLDHQPPGVDVHLTQGAAAVDAGKPRDDEGDVGASPGLPEPQEVLEHEVEAVAIRGEHPSHEAAFVRLPLRHHNTGHRGHVRIGQLSTCTLHVAGVEFGVRVQNQDPVVIFGQGKFLDHRFDGTGLASVGEQFEDVDPGLGGDLGGGVRRGVRDHVDVPVVEKTQGRGDRPRYDLLFVVCGDDHRKGDVRG